ncbi:MAG: efflux RND transporter periplasmic adaptor subunit, partial [Congregibacter sp.]|nr:efflux RND transporter periplasmic adaptor subunit [Congregibacter sp.]
MKSTLKMSPALVLLALFASALFAQEQIAISDADISRMGIVFAPVRTMDDSAGARFPATVINSPDAVTTLSARYAGVIESWQQTSGSAVSAGQTLAVIRSPEILSVQNAWIAAAADDERAQFELRKDQALFDQGVIARQRLVQTRNRAQQAGFAERSARAQLGLAGFDEERLKALRESGTGLGRY